MDVKELSYNSNSLGFMLHYRGKPIGGAQADGTVSHTSDGSIRHWKHRRANMNLHSQSAQRELDHIIDGSGDKRYIDAIKRIEEAYTRKQL